jgi:hypothetical protein
MHDIIIHEVAVQVLSLFDIFLFPFLPFFVDNFIPIERTRRPLFDTKLFLGRLLLLG